MPPPAPSIIGWVTIGGSYNHPVPNVRIDAGDKTVFTNAGGGYRIYGLAAGDYTVTASKSGYSMQPSEIPVTVPPQGGVRADFIARPVSSYPPVVLVHGYLGLSGPRDECEWGVDHYDEPGGYGFMFEYLPQWLVADGFDVWVADWDSGQWPETSATFEYNGGCLARDIAMVKQLTGASQVILLAHSMGGHVSRAYLQSDTYAARNDVQTLILFGSAQGGISALHLTVFGFVGAAGCLLHPSTGVL